MSGQAESLRSNQDQPVSELVNGDFEDLLEPDKPAGWYYLRQAAIAAGGPGSAAGRAITFTNRVAGRSSQALQALGIDGRHASYLAVDLWVQAAKSRRAKGASKRRGWWSIFSTRTACRWASKWWVPGRAPSTGSRKSGHLKVPPAARVAIVALGLLGTTGELSCDQVSIRVVNPRTAQR